MIRVCTYGTRKDNWSSTHYKIQYGEIDMSGYAQLELEIPAWLGKLLQKLLDKRRGV